MCIHAVFGRRDVSDHIRIAMVVDGPRSTLTCNKRDRSGSRGGMGPRWRHWLFYDRVSGLRKVAIHPLRVRQRAVAFKTV